MVKSNIREQTANKLNFFDIILERVIDGQPVSVDSVQKAQKDIKAVIDWLDKKVYKSNVREQAMEKLKSFDSILVRIVEKKTVSVETARNGRGDVKEIMAWLDKRKYKTNNPN